MNSPLEKIENRLLFWIAALALTIIGNVMAYCAGGRWWNLFATACAFGAGCYVTTVWKKVRKIGKQKWNT
jgi:cell division protein FtsW (lipid II flippase)